MAGYVFSEYDIKRLLAPYRTAPFIFLETASLDSHNYKSFLFTDFVKILTFNHTDDISAFFSEAEHYRKRGFWLAGYFSYEFGYYVEPALRHLQKFCDTPLAWLGVCKKPLVINHSDYKPCYENINLSCAIEDVRSNITASEYQCAIKRIKQYLEDGLTYQVNFTFKLNFEVKADILDCYLHLRRSQPTSYAALISTGTSYILSFSPELFFRLHNGTLTARPMKGTAARGRTLLEDQMCALRLAKDKKVRAENVMIVDLLRNDLGKLAERVWVPKLFTVEKYRTLWQLSSTIESKVQNGGTLKSIFSALFPSGSVTGAPKIKTMEIIQGLEKEPRGIYTGAIGYIRDKEARFNVAIRTAFIKDGKAELGVGGGIVYDSIDHREYEEALLKARFLLEAFPNISLIESILWDEKHGYVLLDLHIKRLRNSCSYFSIPLKMKRVTEILKHLETTLHRGKHKVRLTVSSEGHIHIEHKLLTETVTPVKIKISSQRTNPEDVFLYHKTNQREVYERERRIAEKEGYFEVIFFNTRGELTEGTITNLFLLKEGTLYTPPLECGLLGGVLRQHLLGLGKAKEGILYANDLFKADKIYIGNSVQGLLGAKVSLADLDIVNV